MTCVYCGLKNDNRFINNEVYVVNHVIVSIESFKIE